MREGARPLSAILPPTKHGWRIAIVLTSLLISISIARADEVIALYRASWAGLPAGQIRLTMRDGSGSYWEEIAIGAQGLPKLVTHFRGTAIVEGRLVGNRPPQPLHYDASYDLRKRRDRRLAMPFVSRDGAVVAERGPGDTSRKPALAEQFRRNVIDPLSVLNAIRQALRRGETNFTVPVYDGARRFDAEVRVLPRDKSTPPAIHLTLTLRAIAGFKGETSEDGDPDDAPRPMSLTLTDDVRLLPLAMSVPIYFFPLEVEFVRLCESAASCGW
jgi:hypothetical protein